MYGDLIKLAKKAAIDVINALTIADHFGVVLFDREGQTPEQYLLQANKDNK
jgi:hypothetical protein